MRMAPWEMAAGTGAMALALFVRLAYVLPAGFPLNDGGLFYTMARDVQASRFLLPLYTSYNGLDIPFAYPPLAFYLAAALDMAGPWGLLDILRFLPMAANVLTVGAFFLLARAILGPGRAAVFAAFLYALLPRVFLWQVGGGGLTRSLGLLWAVLALWQAYLMFREGRPRGGAVAFAALAVLTHPEMGMLVAFSYLLFWAAYGRGWRGLMTAAVTGTAVALITAPWWGTVVARHGVQTLAEASLTGKSDWFSWRFVNLIHPYIAEEPLFPLLAMVGYGGMAIALAKGRLLLPAWFLLILYIDPRVAYTNVMIPLAMMGGLAMDTLLELAVAEARPLPHWLARKVGPLGEGRPWIPWAWAGLVLVLAYGLYSALHAGAQRPTPLAALSPQVREAMAWIAQHTPKGARFVVVHDWPDPWTDAVSEWFPALTGRQSVATVQGYEWLGKEEFDRQLALYWALQGCVPEGRGDCLERWAQAFGISFDYVFVPCDEEWGCASALALSLYRGMGYLGLYHGVGGYVFHRLPFPPEVQVDYPPM